VIPSNPRLKKVKLPAPPAGVAAIEYYLQANGGGKTVCFPSTAPTLNQTVVVLE
jgi:hypothetical protein